MIFPDFISAPPAVYAVGNEYQIFLTTSIETLMWVNVGNEEYYDDSNGILRSGSSTHVMSVPMEELDRAGKYTICFRRVYERKPYFSTTGEIETLTFQFRPLKGPDVSLYMIADTHNRINAPVEAGRFFGDKLDLLILNGDIPNDSNEIRFFEAFHQIAGRITQGEIPVVCSRGNHDLRGSHAEDLEHHMPGNHGVSYYTFRLGPVWGIVMDCGEDKADDHEAYGHTICCHAFRKRETKFLEQVIRTAAQEYDAPSVKYRLVVCHIPFSDIHVPPFDIEQELYKYWCKLLRENVKPDIMLCGHRHQTYVSRSGSEWDKQGQPCPVVVGSLPGKDWSGVIGSAIELTPQSIRIRFTDQDHKVLGDEILPYRG